MMMTMQEDTTAGIKRFMNKTSIGENMSKEKRNSSTNKNCRVVRKKKNKISKVSRRKNR